MSLFLLLSIVVLVVLPLAAEAGGLNSSEQGYGIYGLMQERSFTPAGGRSEAEAQTTFIPAGSNIPYLTYSNAVAVETPEGLGSQATPTEDLADVAISALRGRRKLRQYAIQSAVILLSILVFSKLVKRKTAKEEPKKEGEEGEEKKQSQQAKEGKAKDSKESKDDKKGRVTRTQRPQQRDIKKEEKHKETKEKTKSQATTSPSPPEPANVRPPTVTRQIFSFFFTGQPQEETPPNVSKKASAKTKEEDDD